MPLQNFVQNYDKHQIFSTFNIYRASRSTFSSRYIFKAFKFFYYSQFSNTQQVVLILLSYLKFKNYNFFHNFINTIKLILTLFNFNSFKFPYTILICASFLIKSRLKFIMYFKVCKICKLKWIIPRQANTNSKLLSINVIRLYVKF